MDITIKSLIAMVIADIDIFLLQNEDQTTDNDKESFSRPEIREQLKSTMINTCHAMNNAGFDIDKSLEISSFEQSIVD